MFALRQIPNLITVIRILLVVPIAWALVARKLNLAIALFVLAAVSDAADGFLAKRFSWQSELGSILDPIADKVLMMTAFVTLALLGWVPLWLMVAAVLRDVIIVGGAAAYRFFVGPLRAHPTAVSKINTLCQALFILTIVTRAAVDLPPAWVTMALGGLVFATIVVSGIDYVVVYARRAVRERAAR